MRATRPSFSIAFRSFWLTTLISAGGRRFAVPYAREAEEIARKLRAARMEDEGSAHAEDSAEKAGLEDDIVSRRSLTGSRGGGCGRAVGRPVVLSEHERGEVDFMRKLEEAFQRGGPRIEGCRPGFDVRDVFETARQRLQQLLLLSRRAQEDARLVHPFLQLAESATHVAVSAAPHFHDH